MSAIIDAASWGFVLGIVLVLVGALHAFGSNDMLDAMIKGYGPAPGPIAHAVRRVLGWVAFIVSLIVIVGHFLVSVRELIESLESVSDSPLNSLPIPS